MSSRPSRSLQEWLHWFEIGDGAHWVRFAALGLAVLLLSCFVGYKQFRGPLSETTFAQAVVARQVAEGAGFTTLVNYPQSFAWADAQNEAGRFVNVARPLPELHQPPLYAAVLAMALKIFPARGANADYVLLAVNVLLLWCAASQTFFLARRLFGTRAGVVAVCALSVSSPVWAAAMAVNGSTLSMVLWLAFFQLGSSAYSKIDDENARAALQLRQSRWLVATAGGILAGLLFLCDYSAIVVVPVMWVVTWLRVPGWRRARSLVLFTVGFAAVIAPCVVRNSVLAGNPLAFSWEGIVLKSGDPTAEPAARRATFSTSAPAFDLAKLGNKMLTAAQRGIGEKIWSAGGLFLTAFFAAGLAYRFRNVSVNRLRWLVVAMLCALALGQAFFDSGEGERGAWLCMTPLVVIFGAGFFMVLVESSEALAARAGLAALVLLAAQALPLARDLAEPRGAHYYNYPPYLPAQFAAIGQGLSQGRAAPLAWMCDVPAGAAWYSGQRVWAQPATLDGVARASHWEPVRALVLTPATLAKPFFGGLTKPQNSWAGVYRGLVTGRMPEDFALKAPIRLADDFYVLVDPATPVVANH